MQASKRRAQVHYAGQVQGVGFRYTARGLAQGFAVTGFVRNLPDGRVELVAEGEEEEVKGLLRAVGQSEVGPLIRHETVTWSDATDEFERFGIVM